MASLARPTTVWNTVVNLQHVIMEIAGAHTTVLRKLQMQATFGVCDIQYCVVLNLPAVYCLISHYLTTYTHGSLLHDSTAVKFTYSIT